MIFATVKSFFEALTKVFSYAEKSKEKQCETEILKNKKFQEKKNDKQEDLLIDMSNLLMRYQKQMSRSDRKKVDRCLKRMKGAN